MLRVVCDVTEMRNVRNYNIMQKDNHRRQSTTAHTQKLRSLFPVESLQRSYDTTRVTLLLLDASIR